MRTCYFAVELWRARFDIHRPHSLVFDLPVKTGLKFMAPIGSDGTDPERKLFDNLVHELDRTILIMFRKDL